MKINLLIRTYVVENLYISLFDIPNKINKDNVELYVHNDNPNNINEFNKIIKEFINKYPNYKINIIQENINQHMFMSYFRSIKHFNENNYWSMILDDDDSMCDFNNINIIEFLKNKENFNHYIKYKISTITDNIKVSKYCLYHRIYPTYALKNILIYENIITNLLIKYNNSTKFFTLEDKLMVRIVNIITKLKTIIYNEELINYNIYYHNVNGYECINKINFFKFVNANIKIKNIITELKTNINN